MIDIARGRQFWIPADYKRVHCTGDLLVKVKAHKMGMLEELHQTMFFYYRHVS
jgi:hypothetical protein